MTREQVIELRDEILKYGFDYDEYWSDAQRLQVEIWWQESVPRYSVYKV